MVSGLGGTASRPVWLLGIKKETRKEMRSKGRRAARMCKALSAAARVFLLFGVGWEGIQGFWRGGS